jgi:hypothetical protein
MYFLNYLVGLGASIIPRSGTKLQAHPPSDRERDAFLSEHEGRRNRLVRRAGAGSRGSGAREAEHPQGIWNRAEYKAEGRSDARAIQALRVRPQDRLDFGVGRKRIETGEQSDEREAE